MKFGKNLVHLSVPEWKVYNLDYNDLKTTIREVTQANSPNLRELHSKFLENFDYLNLFVLTKSGELSRKLKMSLAEYKRIHASQSEDTAKFARLNELHYQVINETSTELRKLTKFLLVQKIAVKKIFKKFAKHYPDENMARMFIDSLTHTLQTNPQSFTSFDLTPLTADLLVLLELIEQDLKTLHEQIHRKFPNRLQKTHSMSTIKTIKTDTYSQASEPAENANLDGKIDQAGRFDLITMLKKNFALHTLIPKDTTSRNDVSLSMDVYLHIPKLKSSRLSVVYLTTSSEDENPSYILLYADELVSLVVAYTGGLRKYSYCNLPNSVVESLLTFLNAEDEPARQQVVGILVDFLDNDSLSSMTKHTINSILYSEVRPTLKLVCNRSRYFLPKDAPEADDTVSASGAPVEAKSYADSYYLTLDENIFTSNAPGNVVSFDTGRMDAFPFSRCSIHSNDATLHNFEQLLVTTLSDDVVQNKFRPIELRRMPVKVQNLVNNTSVYFYKNLSLFDYMRSCYCNVMPSDTNNHFLVLLSANLFKGYENVETVNTQASVDDSIIQDKARSILNRQLSCRSIQISTQVPYETKVKEFRVHDLEQLEDEEDEYFVYLTLNNDLEDNWLNNFILLFIKMRHRTSRALRALHLLPKPEKPDHYLNYDLINEDPTFFNSTNDYQIQLVADYDDILSAVYFTLCFTAMFISAINVGIVYGILKLQDEDIRFNILNNLGVFMLLVFGYIFALLFSMTSFNFNFRRFSEPPASHTVVISAGFLMVTVSVVWTVIMTLPLHL